MNLYHEIKVLSHLLRREFSISDEKAKLESFTSSGGSIIGFLAHADGDVFQKDVEAHFSIRRSTASKMLQSLEEKGIIRRVSVERDARLKKIILTELGWDMHYYVSGAIERINTQATKGIDNDELCAFYSTLEKIKINMLRDKNCLKYKEGKNI